MPRHIKFMIFLIFFVYIDRLCSIKSSVYKTLRPSFLSMQSVDILILGAGWTSDFLIPLLHEKNIQFSATTRDGSPRSGQNTISFTFDPDSDDSTPFNALPDAVTVLITFPIYKSGASEKLVRFWQATHKGSSAAFIQLGSTGIWNVSLRLFGAPFHVSWEVGGCVSRALPI